MSSFFNKVFGDSGEVDKKQESHLPKPNGGTIESPFNIARSKPSSEMSHQLFGQLAEAEASNSSEPFALFAAESGHGTHPQGFVRPEKLPVRGFTAGELASLLPPEFINYQSMPTGQEVDLDLTRARQSMATGRPAVMLSDIYAACPRLFARPITADQDFEVRLPMKRVEALLGMTGYGNAGGPFSPFQLSPNTHHSSSAERYPSSGSPSSSPFEVVGSVAPQAVVPQPASVPLFSQPAPMSPQPTAFSSVQFVHQQEVDKLVKLPLGKALRFVSVDVLGFSASNVPESVNSEIPACVIKQRNPNGSATLPLSVLVSGLEPVYRSAFNQADMLATVTVPADVLPELSMMMAPPKFESAPDSPMSAEHFSNSAVLIESPFAAYAREDAKKREVGARQGSSIEDCYQSNLEQPGRGMEIPANRGFSEDTRALEDLSKRLSAFREQTHKGSAPNDHSPVRPVTAEQVKPLAPLSGLPTASFPHPQPKFRDLQEVDYGSDGGEESFVQAMAAAPVPTHDSEAVFASKPTPAPPARSVSAFSNHDQDDDWKQVELKAVFGFDRSLDSRGVFELIRQLDDVRCAAFIEGEETKFASAGFGDMAPVLAELILKVRQLSDEIGIQGAQSFALQINRGAVMFFSEGNGTIAVMSKGGDISRASKQRIILILRELVRG